MYNYKSDLTQITNAQFTKNIASDEGGAMYNHSPIDGVLDNVVFQENEADRGGGIY